MNLAVVTPCVQLRQCSGTEVDVNLGANSGSTITCRATQLPKALAVGNLEGVRRRRRAGVETGSIQRWFTSRGRQARSPDRSNRPYSNEFLAEATVGRHTHRTTA